MKFSIVIPVYNSAHTIWNVLQSVKNQTLKEYDVYVIDDGSTDNSAEIVERFILENQQMKISLIKTENKGVSKARNLGIKNAKSEYIALLDADDLWHIQKLELISLVLSDEYSFFGHQSTLNAFTDGSLVLNKKDIKVYSFKDLIIKNRFVTPSVVFRNNSIVLFDEDMDYTEDHELWLRLSYKKDALFLDIPLVKLNRPVLSKGGASEARWKMRQGEIKMYIKATKYSLFCRCTLPFLVLFSVFKHVKSFIKL